MENRLHCKKKVIKLKWSLTILTVKIHNISPKKIMEFQSSENNF